jgi:hypothetical protein
VFAAQSESHFTGNSSEDLVGRVNHKPLVHHVSGFGAERFGHEIFYQKGFVGSFPRSVVL